jgi:putative endonuclease
MAKHLETGKHGEDVATKFLVENGYEIIERNYREGKAEIDIIAQKGIFLVFVEVKSLTNLTYGMPEDSVNKRKITLVMGAAETYIYKINWQKEIRFDIIAIVFDKITGKTLEIEHFQDAFY